MRTLDFSPRSAAADLRLAFLVVASEGVTGRAELAKALHLLSEFPIAGVVLNRAAVTTPNYDYGYYSDAGKGASDKGA